MRKWCSVPFDPAQISYEKLLDVFRASSRPDAENSRPGTLARVTHGHFLSSPEQAGKPRNPGRRSMPDANSSAQEPRDHVARTFNRDEALSPKVFTEARRGLLPILIENTISKTVQAEQKCSSPSIHEPLCWHGRQWRRGGIRQTRVGVNNIKKSVQKINKKKNNNAFQAWP